MLVKNKCLHLLLLMLLIMSLFLWIEMGCVLAQSDTEVSLHGSESTLKMEVPFVWTAKSKDVEQEWYGKITMKQWYQTNGEFYIYVELADFKDDFYQERLNEQKNNKGQLLKHFAKKYMDNRQNQFRKKNIELTITDTKQGKLGDDPMIVYETSYPYKEKNWRGIYVFWLHGSNFWVLKYYMPRDNQRAYTLAQNITQSVTFTGLGFNTGSNVSTTSLPNEKTFSGSESDLKLSLPAIWTDDGRSGRGSSVFKESIWSQSFEKEKIIVTVELRDYNDEEYQKILESCKTQEKVLGRVVKTYLDAETEYLKKKGIEFHYDEPIKKDGNQMPTLGINSFFKHEGQNVRRVFMCSMCGSNLWTVSCMTQQGDKQAEQLAKAILTSIKISGFGLGSSDGSSSANNSSNVKPRPRQDNRTLGSGIIAVGLLVALAGFFLKK